MTINGTWSFLRRWWFIGAALVGLGGWAAQLQGSVENKAPLEDVTTIKRDIAEIKAEVKAIGERQQQYYCQDKPAWCR